MAIGPYDLCPCGSGKQFKWCCQAFYPLIEKATLLFQNKQEAAALAVLNELTTRHSTSASAWTFKAQILMRMGKNNEAEEILDTALKLDPNSAFTYAFKASIREQEGELVGAIILLRKGLEVVPLSETNIQFRMLASLSDLEMQMQRPLAIRCCYERMLKLNPTNRELNDNFQNMFGADSELPASTIKEYPLRAVHGQTPDRFERLTDLLKKCEATVQDNPSSPAAHYNLALVRAWLGDDSKALDSVKTSIDLEEDPAFLQDLGALNQILRYSVSMVDQADNVRHIAHFLINDPSKISQLFEKWGEQQLRIIHVDRESGNITGFFCEPASLADSSNRMISLSARFQIINNLLEISDVRSDKLQAVVQKLSADAGSSIEPLETMTTAASYRDFITEYILFPADESSDSKEIIRRNLEATRGFLEGTWLNRSMKSLDGNTPIDAAAHPKLKKRLPGLIAFVSQCILGNTKEYNIMEHYDFNRLSRRLGLIPSVGNEIDFETISVAELGQLAPDKLDDQQILQSFRAAHLLDAKELAGNFARKALERPGITDVHTLINFLARQAQSEGHYEEALTYFERGLAGDPHGPYFSEFNTGRARIYAKMKQGDKSHSLFREVIQAEPKNLSNYSRAAETMLSLDRPKDAAWFAEKGLVEARAQSSRQDEAQLMELQKEANKRLK